MRGLSQHPSEHASLGPHVRRNLDKRRDAIKAPTHRVHHHVVRTVIFVEVSDLREVDCHEHCDLVVEVDPRRVEAEELKQNPQCVDGLPAQFLQLCRHVLQVFLRVEVVGTVLISIGVGVHLRMAALDRRPRGAIGLGREFDIGFGQLSHSSGPLGLLASVLV